MAYDGRVMARAMERLQQRRDTRARRLQQRREEVHAQLPRAAELDRQLRGSVAELIGLSLRRGEDPQAALARLRQDNLAAQGELADLLCSRGYPADYLEDKADCLLCADSGYVGREPCRCLLELYSQEQRRELSALLDLGEQRFDRFCFDCYDEEPDPERGISPRENMALIYDLCVDYARNFGPGAENLFLHGGTGLGKTFLSACIAREVSDRGYSVVYDTAVNVFARFEAEKFSRDPEDSQTARDETRRYLNCDLLILDDLGTEMTTPFVQSALYTLLNTRLVRGRSMVLNSNLTLKELERRYSPQIASRILGEFRDLPVFGADLRRRDRD